ncbi:MAG: serine/threonine-protein kinase [Deltaproteobacteria bacterium]|nr:serine/threonine-protein kinase [Deltaproteobacteria bacterium]
MARAQTASAVDGSLLDTERWHQVDALFAAAVDLPTEKRAEFLDQSCSGDPSLRAEVLALLEAHERADAFLARPLARLEDPPTLVARPSDETGRRLGPYRLLRSVGEGGMGAVYLGAREDDQYERLVAVKVVRGGLETPELLERFRRERQILASLKHPYIARLYDGGTSPEGLPYLAMELVEGQPITAFCDHHGLGLEARLELFRKVCSAVQHAHQYLLVHRDLKPANILVEKDGTPKLLDFGIAKPLEGAPLEVGFRTSESGSRLMTLDYASPEQVRGEAIGTASDVYSLGVLLFELLSGTKPHQENTAAALERAICDLPVPLPSEKAASVPSAAQRARRLRGDLDNIVLKALRKEPERRYGTAADLGEDLRRFQTDLPVRARPDTGVYRFQKFVRRNSLAVGAAVLIGALLAGSSIVTQRQAQKISRQRDIAERERGRAEQVSTFLVDLFENADPRQARGEDLRVREILDRGVEKLDTLADQPDLQAQQRVVIGRVYRSLGLFEESEKLLRQGLKQSQQFFGPKHEEVASILAELGELQWLQDRPEAAEELFRQTLAIRREVLTAPHVGLVTTLVGLGVLRQRQGDYAAAETLYVEALDMARVVMGEDESHLPVMLDNLASLRQAQGNFLGARPIYQEALGRARDAFGNDHPDTAIAMDNFASLLEDLGEHEEAEALFREALTVTKQIYGEDHPSIARAQNNFAGLLRTTGRYEEAAPLYGEALTTFRDTLGEESRRYLTCLFGQGRLLADQGDLERGEAAIREAIALRQERLGLEDRQLALYLEGLGFVLQEKGDLSGAQEALSKALDIRLETLPEDHPSVAEGRTGLARVLLARGEAQQAEALLTQALDSWRIRLPAEHWKISWAETLFGASLAHRGERAEARRWLEAGLPTLEARLGRRAPYTRDAEGWLRDLIEPEGSAAAVPSVPGGSSEIQEDRGGKSA